MDAGQDGARCRAADAGIARGFGQFFVALVILASAALQRAACGAQ